MTARYRATPLTFVGDPCIEAALALVVNDEWLIASTLEMMIREIGHDAAGPAADVSQALDLFAERPLDGGAPRRHLGEGEELPDRRGTGPIGK